MKHSKKNNYKLYCLLGIIIILIITLLIISLKLILNKNDGIGTAGISRNEFQEIELGMSQFEVNSIIDKQDEWKNESVYDKCCEEISKNNKDRVYTFTYKYYGEKGGYALITYTSDFNKDKFAFPEVTEKEQFGLK